MVFKQWFFDNKKQWPASKIAAAIGVSRVFVYDLLNQRKTPSLQTANKLHQLTGGAVTHGDWPRKDKVSNISNPSNDKPAGDFS